MYPPGRATTSLPQFRLLPFRLDLYGIIIIIITNRSLRRVMVNDEMIRGPPFSLISRYEIELCPATRMEIHSIIQKTKDL